MEQDQEEVSEEEFQTAWLTLGSSVGSWMAELSWAGSVIENRR